MSITEREASRLGLGGGKKKRKYRNIPTVVDGITFASRKEARRYGELILMQRAGEIDSLACHPKFVFFIENKRIGNYTADFAYYTSSILVVEDVKSPATRKNSTYRLKIKLLKALHGIDVTEV